MFFIIIPKSMSDIFPNSRKSALVSNASHSLAMFSGRNALDPVSAVEIVWLVSPAFSANSSCV